MHTNTTGGPTDRPRTHLRHGEVHVPTYPTCTPTCTTDCGHCKGNHEQARLGQIRARLALSGPPAEWYDAHEVAEMLLFAGTEADDVEPDSRLIAHAHADLAHLLGLLAEKDATIRRVRDLAAANPPCKDVCNCHHVDPVEILDALDGQEGR